MTFGDYLKQKREARNWTQPDAAHKVQIEQSYLSKLETGKSYPSEEIFERLIKVFDINMDDLQQCMDSPELEKLSDTRQIRQLIIAQKKSELSMTRSWLLTGLIFLMLGGASLAITKIYDGAQSEYIYRSQGILLPGEPLRAFAIINEDIPKSDIAQYIKQQKLLNRISQDDIVTTRYRSQSFLEDMPDGKRLYELISEYELPQSTGMNWFLIPGVMFLLGALGAFFISFRWK